jgi:MtN3 and saliva related transmembrane protein
MFNLIRIRVIVNYLNRPHRIFIMDFSIFDDSVSTTMNVFLVIGNIINFVYNVPQVAKTYKTKSTKDFSPTFLFMRVIGNSIWLAYSIQLQQFLFMLSNIVSVLSSAFMSYYKLVELYQERLIEYNTVEEDEEELNEKI